MMGRLRFEVVCGFILERSCRYKFRFNRWRNVILREDTAEGPSGQAAQNLWAQMMLNSCWIVCALNDSKEFTSIWMVCMFEVCDVSRHRFT